MKFNDLEWSAFCFFYRSVEDKNYVRVMADVPFLRELRNSPAGINPREFEEKVILNLIKIENYDLLLKRNLAAQLLAAIVELQPELSLLRDASILNCDLFEDAIVNSINNAYRTLCAIPGLWSTGAT
jgi:hypothetical protein